MRLLAIFGPTGVGKTAVAIAVAELLRARGEDPVAISCDSIQVYRGLEVLSGAATAAERERLEHRLLGFVESRRSSAPGASPSWPSREIDGLLAEGRRPIVVGGTGLYLRAALAELELRPPVDPRSAPRSKPRSTSGASEALHAELERPRPPASPPATASASLRADRAAASRPLARARPRAGRELWTARPAPPDAARRPDDGPRGARRPDRRPRRRDGRRRGRARRREAADRRRRLPHRPRGARLRGAARRATSEAMKTRPPRTTPAAS